MPLKTHAAETSTAQALDSEDALQLLLRKPRNDLPATPVAGSIVIGTLTGISPSGHAHVLLPNTTEISAASSLVAVGATDIGRAVAVSFPGGTTLPLMLGFIWSPQVDSMTVEVDGEHKELVASESLTLRCGKASITLTADGQILLRGAYISSHSSGTQRIKGASVRIN
jgi:uncharacterized protein (DUF2345 family)